MNRVYQGPEANHEKERFSHTKTMFLARDNQVFDGELRAPGSWRRLRRVSTCLPPNPILC